MAGCGRLDCLIHRIPIVSIVVPFFGLTNYFVLRILKGNPKKELQWRL